MSRLSKYFIFLFLTLPIFGGSGIFQTYVVVNLNSGGNSFYAGSTNPDGATRWDAVDLGTITSSTSLLLIGGEIKTFKNGGSDVTGAALFYRVYKSGDTPGSYSSFSLPFAENLVNPGDQKWQSLSNSIQLRSLMTSPGTWVIDIYWEAYTNIDGTHQNTGGGSKNVTGDATLPVELVSFTCEVVDYVVNLNWATATEINNFGFAVERKAAGSDWNQVAFIEGSGNSNAPKVYNYLDKNVDRTQNYQYRLKQIDNDGTFEYSHVVEANFAAPVTFNLDQNYPNPFNPSTKIRFSVQKDEHVSLQVYTIDGEKAAELFNGPASAGVNYELDFNGENLSSGVYYYKLVSASGTQVRKMLLMK